jgi:hypothetical protein
MLLPPALDDAFPWIVFAYGALVALALGSKRVLALGERYVPSDLWARFQRHRIFALICLVVGALWIAQGLIVG